jgi:transposase
MEALRMRETFQQIYHAETENAFSDLLQKWTAWVGDSTLEPMRSAAQTILNHWNGIVRWKASQINNGILEGLNSLLQAAKRKARGYSKKHFATMAFLITGKLNLASVNPHLPTRFA